MTILGPLVVAFLAVGAKGDNPKLEAGIELYRSGDLKGSLSLLLEALDTGGVRERARARLYVGLIQHRTGNTRDARASFRRALELSPSIRPPRATPAETRATFEQVREEVAPSPPPRQRAKTKTKTKVKAKPPRSGDVRRGPELLEPVEEDGGPGVHQQDWSVERRRAPSTVVGVQQPVEEEQTSLPTVGWIAAGAGAAALIAGATLAVVSSLNTSRALDDPDATRARQTYDGANVQHKASFGAFGAAGLLFGVAALTVAF